MGGERKKIDRIYFLKRLNGQPVDISVDGKATTQFSLNWGFISENLV